MFDIKKIPFSRYGSYIAISTLWDSDDLYIRTVRGGDINTNHGKVFKIETVDNNGDNVPYEVDMKEHVLTLSCDNGYVKFCIDNVNNLRVYGKGIGLKLTMECGYYDNCINIGNDKYKINSATNDIKYLITNKHGSIEVKAPWNIQRSEYIEFIFTPKEYFYGIIEEFKTVPRYEDYDSSFLVCEERVRKSYKNWLDNVLDVSHKYKRGKELASYITWSCVVNKDNNLTRDAMYMSKNWMTNIWSWDNCFNAMALIKNNPKLAYDQLMIFFDMQDDSGLLPDFANDKYSSFSFTKPPIHGWTIDYMIKENPKFFNNNRLKELYRPLKKWTDYWFKYTDYDYNNIPSYDHGNDAGWDNSTIFDNGSPVKSPDLLSFLILNMKTLSHMAGEIGLKSEANYYEKAMKHYINLLIEYFYIDNNFVPKDLNDNIKYDGDSLIMCVPIILGQLLPKEITNKIADDIEDRFLTEHGLSTESIYSKYYRDDGYWRGPIWAPSTIIIVDGLERSGHGKLAREISHRFLNMVNKNGMAENFNAKTGEGLRDKAFTWTSSVFLILGNKYK